MYLVIKGQFYKEIIYRERSGSVVECLTLDRGAVSSSGIEPHRRHCVVSLSKTH